MCKRSILVFAAVVVLLSCTIPTWGVPAQSNTVKAVITIDAAKTGEPISRYIYGQFIEHLGRCIYGGIWAEMLEDRKFYYPVPATGQIWQEHKGAMVLAASPWQVIGPEGTVRMVTENSYVGEQTPEIQLTPDGSARGIFQAGLALIKNKEYEGRVVVAGAPQAGPVEVSLVWGPGKNDRQTLTINRLSRDFTKIPFSFDAGGGTENGRLEIVGRGSGAFMVGTVSLMPADNVKGMRADTLKLLKQLNAPIYRWPGGNFVSGYDWHDGIGERDRRPPRKNPAWTGIEHNDFGFDEYMTFCREIDAEPLVVVNSGLGDENQAVTEVEYANGSLDTPMGKLRAKNGHPKPYGVKWWGIGNEMYGNWQLGHIPLKKYVLKHNVFVKAMRKVDASIKVIGVGALGDNGWSRTMLENCADYMDLISEHFYKGAKDSVIDHVQQMNSAVISKVRGHRKFRKEIAALKGKDIRIALDEWNYWHRPYEPEYGELGCRYTLRDALGIAVGLHEMIRNSDMVFMAGYAQTVNVIGCIKTSKTQAAFATTGLALELYRNHFGVYPVEVSGNLEPLDVAAAWTTDRSALTIAIVNPTGFTCELPLDVRGVRLSSAAQRWVITGTDPMVYNEPGKPAKVEIRETTIRDRVLNSLQSSPMSVSLYRIAVR